MFAFGFACFIKALCFICAVVLIKSEEQLSCAVIHYGTTTFSEAVIKNALARGNYV